jgi:hypothetical protein
LLVGLEMDAKPMIALIHLPVGVALGVLYFHTMWRSVDMLAGAAPLKTTFVAMALRFALLAAVLSLIGQEGALPLLLTAAGIMAGRFLVMRRVVA